MPLEWCRKRFVLGLSVRAAIRDDHQITYHKFVNTISSKLLVAISPYLQYNLGSAGDKDELVRLLAQWVKG